MSCAIFTSGAQQMINFSSRERVAALAILAGVGLAIAPAQAEQPSAPSLKTHGPVQVLRRPDGSIERGLRNQIVTSNWSGYAIAHYQTGQNYTSAAATWTVPAVTFDSTQSGTSEEYSATWVGIGGFCQNALCTRADRTLIQLGTSQNVSSSGDTSYSAWYEMIPQSPVTIAIAVKPGDQITASLNCNPCSKRNQVWQLSMTNTTTGQTWSQNVSYSSSLASADWIVEAPVSAAGVLPLADFNVVGIAPSFNNTDAWNALTLSANSIQMTDPYGQTSNPSSTDSNGFNACWGYGGMTNCSNP
jgi:hypothetical protein